MAKMKKDARIRVVNRINFNATITGGMKRRVFRFIKDAITSTIASMDRMKEIARQPFAARIISGASMTNSVFRGTKYVTEFTIAGT